MSKTGSFLIRYGISTLGLVIAALGVGLSIKSNLGIAPLSCVPTVLSLQFTRWSVGTFTWIFNISFILLQAILLRKKFKWEHAIQVIPVLIFGYLIDGAIWLFNALDAPSSHYFVQIILCLAAVLLTAVGIRIEVVGKGWLLPIDSTLNVLSGMTGGKFSTIKVILDVVLVAVTAVLALVFFGLLTGNGSTVVIREGTVIQAVLTGLCMKVTDPLVDRVFGRVVAKVSS